MKIDFIGKFLSTTWLKIKNRISNEILPQKFNTFFFSRNYRRKLSRSEGAAEFLPPTPSFRRTRADWFKNFAQNGFALFLGYPTIQNFSTFLSQTDWLPRGFAPRLGGFAQGAKPHNPTARKKKRKRTVYLKS